MNGAHLVAIVVIILLALALFLRPKEQSLRVEPTNAQAQAAPPCATPKPVNPCSCVDCYRIPTGRIA